MKLSLMKTFRFRDFVVYQEARQFRSEVRKYINNFPPKEKYKLIDQIDRSCLSVILNIAEGSAKRSDKEFLRFLETAIASLNEVIAGFDCAVDDGLLSDDQMNELEKTASKLARRIGSFMKILRGSKANC